MRALIQRVSEAAVRVDGEITGDCGAGLLVLICAMPGDDEPSACALHYPPLSHAVVRPRKCLRAQSAR